MDHEQNDDRPTDHDETLEQDGQVGPGVFADEFVFEAPDLATAFLAALDAVDDPRFVTTPQDPDPVQTPTTGPTPTTEPAEPIAPIAAAHDEPSPAAASAAIDDDSASARAVEEAFARERAALELWGSGDTGDTSVTSTSTEEVASAESDTAGELFAETFSNADSYYDPDTLALARPLFSPAEPRAFTVPVYTRHASADGENAAEASSDVEAEVLEDLEEFVAFSLGETRCVVPIRNVIEIGRIPDAVGVPNAPTWLHGLGNLRGQVISLIDLRAFLGIGRVRPATGRMLVLRADDDEVQAGLLVDHVHQIVSLSASRFHVVPETLPQHYVRHAWGVCDYGNYTMIGLDVDTLLGVEALTPPEEAEVA
jgi:purine-binding chemotaxis protein CheW